MDRTPVQEDLYEFHHLPGSTPGTYWRDVRAVIAGDAEAREATSSPKGLPSIPVQENRTCPVDRHTPGYHGDSPIPPHPGLPPIPDSRNLPCSTTRPPDAGKSQLFFKKTDIEKKQTRLLDKHQHTHPIHRGMIEAVEEPSAWKLEKKKRIENAIDRVNNNYVIHPRNYQEPDINERADDQFMPTPPKAAKPKPRKHNRVILNPEQMLRDRDHMRGDFAPGRPPGHVPESCYRRAAPQMPTSAYGHAATSTYDTGDGQPAGHMQNGYQVHVYLHHADAYGNALPSATRSAAHMPNTATFDQGREWHQERSRRAFMAQERIQQEYVDELRMEYDEPASSQAEIDLDAKRQKMLSRKSIEKKRRKEAAALKHAELIAASKSEPESGSQPYAPAPPPTGNVNDGSHFTRKRHPVHEHAQSTLEPDSNMTRQVTKGVEGFAGETKMALIPRSTRPTHGPVIRVEPQLTWNASAAKRGLGFKSKLRREQEEAAIQNKGHQDDTGVPGGTGRATPALSEEARRRWKNKTICNQR